MISAPKAKIPHRLQSATAVCRLAPEARYSTETGLKPVSISISRLSSSDSVGSRLFVFGGRDVEMTLKSVCFLNSDWLQRRLAEIFRGQMCLCHPFKRLNTTHDEKQLISKLRLFFYYRAQLYLYAISLKAIHCSFCLYCAITPRKNRLFSTPKQKYTASYTASC